MKRSLSAAALVAATAIALAGCGAGESGKESSGEGRGPITYAQGKDTSGQLQQIVDAWNADHPDEKVTFVELPESADDQRTAFVQDFQAGAGAYDVAGLDVVWTGEFAARKWLLPLDDIDTSALFESTVASGSYDGTLYAAPFNTNAGFLYYRTDLLPTPPTTWAELDAACDVASQAGIGCYGGQFAQYEGLTVNFSEAVNSAGGSVVDEKGDASLDTPEAAAALQHLVDGFTSGRIPAEAITYQEEEGRRAFQQGNLLFLRNWPYVHGLASEEGEDSVIQGKFGIAPLPGLDGPGASTLGGYNLAVSKATDNPQTAKDFIQYMLTEDVQRKVLTEMSGAPTVSALYDDPVLQEQIPYLATLKAALEEAVPRPQAVAYSELSHLVSTQVYSALQGKTSVEDTLAALQKDMQKLIDESADK
jgi:multiple sugar transport system substrate-binding protein